MMKGYLIGEEGPLAGMTIIFEEDEKNEWSLGRDPETSDVILEDPMVSRKHAIVKATPEGFTLENLSTVNPITQNGKIIAEPVLLKEGDIIQIGSTFFNFTEQTPQPEDTEEPLPKKEEKSSPEEEPSAEMPSELHFGPHPETRWLLKVISGPNAGAEFAMHKDATYLIGKDPNICDIVFQDLSVSRQHARLSIDENENVFIEDLGSRNGVIVNGELIDEKHLLSSQDLIALGTTTFLVIDRHEARETIISPAISMPTARPTPAEAEALKEEEKEKKDWKELIIPKRHLVAAGIFGSLVFLSFFGMLALFRTEPIEVKLADNSQKIKEAITDFKGVQFSFNQPSGKIFLVGHVMTTVRHEELLYILKDLPFIQEIDDNVIVDELVWQNMNALITTNPDWIGVSMYSPEPGKFILRGYIQTLEEAVALSDYINLNFDYLDRLENLVVVEENLQAEIESLLMKHGFSNVKFDLVNGDLVLAGKVGADQERSLKDLVNNFKKVPGIREVKNYIVVMAGDASFIDLSKDFKVTGYSKRDEMDYYVVINGKILGEGDLLDGMLITKIKPKIVLLEKEGQKFRIEYNIQ